MITCKSCNNGQGNGYCAKHSTSGVAYLETKMNKTKKKKI